MLNNLKRQWSEIVSMLKLAERFYALDDAHAIRVQIRMDEELVASTQIYQRIEERRGDRVEIDWDYIDLDAVPARLLGRVVEIKMIVERFNAGELADLPPSTTPDFLAEREERRMRRRMR